MRFKISRILPLDGKFCSLCDLGIFSNVLYLVSLICKVTEDVFPRVVLIMELTLLVHVSTVSGESTAVMFTVYQPAKQMQKGDGFFCFGEGGVLVLVCLVSCFCFLLCFLELHPQHMEVPRLDTKLELQLPEAHIIATGNTRPKPHLPP